METLLHLLPKELIYIISNDLNYEDIKNLEEILSFDIMRSIKIIKCEKKYKINNANKYKLSYFSKNTKYIDNGILISIDSPSDFEELINYTSLINCNFILPYNKYESITEFETYLEVFFDVLFRMKFSTLIKYKDLNYRILFQSDYNYELGITMNSGCITLINSEYYIGFSYDIEHNNNNIDNLDYVIDIINKNIKKYEKDIFLFYVKETADFPFIQENELTHVYLDKGIYPTGGFEDKHNNSSEIYKMLKESIDEGVYDNDEKIQKFNEDSDYFCVIVKYTELMDGAIGPINKIINSLGFIKSVFDIIKPNIDVEKFKQVYKKDYYFIKSYESVDSKLTEYELIYNKILEYGLDVIFRVIDNDIKFEVVSLIDSKLKDYELIYKYDPKLKTSIKDNYEIDDTDNIDDNEIDDTDNIDDNEIDDTDNIDANDDDDNAIPNAQIVYGSPNFPNGCRNYLLQIYNQKYDTITAYEHMYFDVPDIKKYLRGINIQDMHNSDDETIDYDDDSDDDDSDDSDDDE
jgi:hypothetical protein